MTPSASPFRIARWHHAAFAVVAVLAAAPALAQYKVVGPDGKVTYTDRAPSEGGRITALGARNAASPADADLPFELRSVAEKYPVTLYTLSGSCESCNSARQLLKARGVPFSERQVVTSEDADALEKLTGAREAPTLMIGSQTLRGLTSDVWASYLDAAGYPRESKLPATYQYRAAAPIVEQRAVAARPAARPADRPAAAAVPAPAPSGIRF